MISVRYIMEPGRYFEYSKEDAKIVNGIALWMMFIHHFWGFPGMLNDETICSFILKVGTINIESFLAYSCRICVFIFAFNTGYVIYKKKENYTFPKNIKRVLKFLVSYWIIYSFILLYGYLLNEQLPNWHEAIENMFGVNCSPLKYVNVSFAWYVFFYVSFILFSPVIVFFIKGKSYIKDFSVLFIWYLIWKSALICSNFIHIPFSLIFSFSSALTTGFISLFACMIAKYRLFEKLNVLIVQKRSINYLIILIVFVLVYFFAEINCAMTTKAILDTVSASLIVFAILRLIHNRDQKSKVYKLLYYTGIYSMNLWFLHSLFFTGSNKIQWILYLPQYSLFVLIWGFILTYPVAVFISKIQSHVHKLLNLK